MKTKTKSKERRSAAEPTSQGWDSAATFDEDFERRFAKAEAAQMAAREAFDKEMADGPFTGTSGLGGAPVRCKRPPATSEPVTPSVPLAGEQVGRLRFGVEPGPLPDAPEELIKILNSPKSLAQAQAAMDKIGHIYNRDATEDMSFLAAEEFNPLVTTLGIGSNPAAIAAFTMHVIPLRRSLGRQFGASSPAVHMLCDMAALSYWRCIQSEHSIVAHLAAALENPYSIQRAALLEKVKDLATKQLVRVLDALRAITGRAIQMDPEAGAAKILRFRQRQEPDGRRLRKACAG